MQNRQTLVLSLQQPFLSLNTHEVHRVPVQMPKTTTRTHPKSRRQFATSRSNSFLFVPTKKSGSKERISTKTNKQNKILTRALRVNKTGNFRKLVALGFTCTKSSFAFASRSMCSSSVMGGISDIDSLSLLRLVCGKSVESFGGFGGSSG